MFVGREAEMKFLQDKYAEDGGQLIVLYGRRRVGKTETLREFCKDKPHVFFSCTQTTERVQLRNFSGRMLKENIPARNYISEFSDWEKAFRAVQDLPYGDRKKLLVIDEFPYMCRGNKSIPSILQNLWDAELRSSNVMIILCGSAMSFMEKELLSEKNPLYGRATGIYRMREMGFYDAAKFFPDYSDRDKVLAYAVLGGIPHYLRQWNPKRSVDENIKQNILTKGCILYSEVEFLLHQELRETPIYNSIIEAVALGNTKLNDISQKSLVEDTSKTSVYLKNLMELGIVEREFSVDAKMKEYGNSGRGIYRLKPALHEFAAFAFEDVCREFVREMQKKNELPFRYAKMGRWFGKTTVRDEKAQGGLRTAETEIDLLGIDREAKEYLVGECKFKGAPFSYLEYLNTLAKLAPEKEKARFHYALFSENGFDAKIAAHAAENETQLYTLDQIVRYK